MDLQRLKHLAGIINETTGNSPEVISRNIINALPAVKKDEQQPNTKKKLLLKRLQVLAGIIGNTK